MEEHARTPYEVNCYACGVTFAIGTKKCLHCGRRLGRGGLRRMTVEPGGLPEVFGPSHAPEAEVAEEQTSGRSKLPISPMTLLWIVIIAASVAQRACQGD